MDFRLTQEDVDNLPQPKEEGGDYPLLRTLVEGATDTTIDAKTLPHEQIIREGYNTLVPKLNALDLDVADMAARNGDAEGVALTLEQIAERQRKIDEGSLGDMERIKEISQAYIDNMTTVNAGVVINNSPQELADKGKHKNGAAALVMHEKAMEEVTRASTGFGRNALGIAQELIPTAAFSGFALGTEAKKYIGDVGTFEAESSIMGKMRAYYDTLPLADKAEFLTTWHKALTDSVSISKWRADLYIQELVTDDPSGVGTDVLNALGIAATAFNLGGVVKGARMMGSGAQLSRKKEVLAAAVGAKPGQVAAAGQELMRQGAMKIAGEATGVSDAVALAKLASSGLARVLPESITTATSAIQEAIKNKTAQAIEDIRSTVRAGNLRPEEGANLIDQLKGQFNPNTNPMVHTLDINAAGAGKVLFKPADPDAQNFLTKEAAQAFIKAFDPSNQRNLAIVPDTTNSGYLVGMNTLEELKRNRAAVEAALLKKLAERPAEVFEGLPLSGPVKAPAAPIPPVVKAPEDSIPPPKSLGMAKPRWKTAEVNFVDAVDKAVYQLTNTKGIASKSDPEVMAWVKEVTGWDDAAIAKHGTAIRNYIKKLPDVGEGASIKVSRQRPAAPTAPAAPTPTPVKTVAEYLGSTYHKVGENTFLSPSAAGIPEVNEFLRKIIPALGMEDSKLVVLTKGDPIPPEMLGVDIVRSRNTGAGGWFHPNIGGYSYIHINRPTSKVDVESFMTVLAHETGHWFMSKWNTKYGDPVRNAFNKWLKARGITTLKDADWVALMQHYDPAKMRDGFGKITAGTKPQVSAAYAAWADDFEEWFCEQFSKWSLSDKVPTSLFDKSMAKLVKSIREIFRTVTEVVSVRLGVKASFSSDKAVAKMMNDHVKEMLDGKMWGKVETDEITTLRKEIADLDDQITAMTLAGDGVRYGWLVKQDFKPILYSQLGKYTDEDINSVMKLNFGDWAFGTSSEAYATRVVGVAQSSRYKKILTDFVQKDIGALNKKERLLLSDALIRGDKEGKDLDSMTLKSMGLSDRAINAYYSARTVRNMMYDMRNDAAVTSLTRKGYVNVIHPNLVDDEGAMSFGRPAKLLFAPGATVYDVTTKAGRRISDEVLERVNSGEYTIYEMESTMSFGGKKHKYVLVPKTEATEAPIRTVIPYRQGEFKRIYEDEYFVRMSGFEEVDGLMTDFVATHRTAKTKGQAEAYVAAFHEVRDAARMGKLTPEVAAKLQPYGWKMEDVMRDFGEGKYNDVKLFSEYTRSQDDYVTKTVSVRNRFSSERGDRLKNVFGQDSDISNPFDSLAAEITNTSFMAPITEWRDATIFRWYNTVENYLPVELRGIDPEKAFAAMQSGRITYVGNDQMKLFAQRVNDYVVHELSVLTKEEELMAGHIRAFSEKFEGKAAGTAFEGAANMTGAWLRHADPVSFARTVSFHSFLGGFNPVQLIVQGLNAFNAAMISPVHGMKAAAWMPALRVALMSENEEVWRNVAKAAKVVGAEEEEFLLTVKSIRRSGLLDGINSTSLYGAETGKWSLTNGLARKAGEVSGFWFNRGEESSRLVSFDIARREFIKANPEAVWWDDAALNKILERQDDLTQNMTNANMGAYQKGILSIPTQFLQYNIKFGMNILAGLVGNKRAFTRQEIASLMMGHMVFFGVAGTGFALTDFGKEMMGEAYEGMDRSTRLAVDQGIAAALVNTMSEVFTGESTELAVGTRFGSLSFYVKFYDGMMDLFSTESRDPDSPTVRDILTGAVGSSIRRMIGNFGNATDLLFASEEVDAATALEVFQLIGTGTFSSLNNLDKAILAEGNRKNILSRNGGNTFSVTEGERLAMAIGIPPVSMHDYEVLMKDQKARQKQQQRFINEARRFQVLAAQAYRDGDKVLYKNYRNSINVIRNGLTNPHDLIAFDKALITTEPESKLRKLLIENMLKDRDALPTVNQTPGELNG